MRAWHKMIADLDALDRPLTEQERLYREYALTFLEPDAVFRRARDAKKGVVA